MNVMTEMVLDALQRASQGVVELDHLGCTVESVRIEGGTPVVRIAEPPVAALADRSVCSALVKSTVGSRALMSAGLRSGCRVTWYDTNPQEVRRGG